MKKVYLVTAHYSDWEWSDERHLGIFDSLEGARVCQDLFEKERTLFLASPSPISEDEMELYYSNQIGEKRVEEYLDWQSRQSNENDFNEVNINEYTLNKTI
jgi:hypothetical protein